MTTDGATNGRVLTLRWLRPPTVLDVLGTGAAVVVLAISSARCWRERPAGAEGLPAA